MLALLLSGFAGRAFGNAATIRRTATPPTLDGRLEEFSGSDTWTFGTPETDNAVIVRALWDDVGLYLAYQVTDAHLSAAEAQPDGPVYHDDAVEWFIDPLLDGDGGTAAPDAPWMQDDDVQGIVNLLETRYDARGASATPQAPTVSGTLAWESAVALGGTLGDDLDIDSGYAVEVKVPWETVGPISPAAGMWIGLGLAIDDKDPSGLRFVMLPHLITTFQNASKWQRVHLSGELAEDSKLRIGCACGSGISHPWGTAAFLAAWLSARMRPQRPRSRSA